MVRRGAASKGGTGSTGHEAQRHYVPPLSVVPRQSVRRRVGNVARLGVVAMHTRDQRAAGGASAGFGLEAGDSRALFHFAEVRGVVKSSNAETLPWA
jgi:hypothetical protein